MSNSADLEKFKNAVENNVANSLFSQKVCIFLIPIVFIFTFFDFGFSLIFIVGVAFFLYTSFEKQKEYNKNYIKMYEEVFNKCILSVSPSSELKMIKKDILGNVVKNINFNGGKKEEVSFIYDENSRVIKEIVDVYFGKKIIFCKYEKNNLSQKTEISEVDDIPDYSKDETVYVSGLEIKTTIFTYNNYDKLITESSYSLYLKKVDLASVIEEDIEELVKKQNREDIINVYGKKYEKSIENYLTTKDSLEKEIFLTYDLKNRITKKSVYHRFGLCQITRYYYDDINQIGQITLELESEYNSIEEFTYINGSILVEKCEYDANNNCTLKLNYEEEIKDLNLDDQNHSFYIKNNYSVKKVLDSFAKLSNVLLAHKVSRQIADKIIDELDMEDFITDENFKNKEVSTYNERNKLLCIEGIKRYDMDMEHHWKNIFLYDNFGNVISDKFEEKYFHKNKSKESLLGGVECEKKYDQKNRLVEELIYDIKYGKQYSNGVYKKIKNKIYHKYDELDNLTVEEYVDEDLISRSRSIYEKGVIILNIDEKIKKNGIKEIITIYQST